MGKVVYHIREDYGLLFIKLEYDRFLDANELAEVISELQLLHQHMVAEDEDQETIRLKAYEIAMQPITQGLVIHYPCNLPFISGVEPNSKSRTPKTPRYSGVYFAQHPDYPGLLKIGCSIDVYQRMKSLYHSLGKTPLKVVAFIPSPDGQSLEGFLHSKFAAHRVRHEFFEEAPVTNWLKEVAK